MVTDASHALAVSKKVSEKVDHFLNAARTGNLDILKKIAAQLDEGTGMAETVEDIKDANKRGALHFAATEGKTEVCKYLVEELILDINTKDEDGNTPLIHAAQQGHTGTAKYLLEHGANPAIENDLGATALHHSAGIGNIELMNYLFSKGVEVDLQTDAGTPLIWAAGHGEKDALKLLLEHHASPNAEAEDNMTSLLSAVAADSLECTELLIQAGARVNAMVGGATALHIAADNGNASILSSLMQAGCDPDIVDEDGLKPIQIAALRGNRAAVEVLLPLTSKVSTVPEWTVYGIIECMQAEAKNREEAMRKLRENTIPMDTTEPRRHHPTRVTPEAKRKAAEAKARGDEAFRRNDYRAALLAYSLAIDRDPTDHILFSNRSLCWIRLGLGANALSDARAARELNADWPKGCYREAQALQMLQRFDEAVNAVREGLLMDPYNVEMITAYRDFVEDAKEFYGRGTGQRKTYKRGE